MILEILTGNIFLHMLHTRIIYDIRITVAEFLNYKTAAAASYHLKQILTQSHTHTQVI